MISENVLAELTQVVNACTLGTQRERLLSELLRAQEPRVIHIRSQQINSEEQRLAA